MFTDTKFMTAKEKAKVLRHWRTFLKHSCKRQHFTKALYHHLIQHCSFIAHMNLDGFYTTYFTSGSERARFLSQFDDRDGPPSSIELWGSDWIRGDYKGSYQDINQAMIDAARPQLDGLLSQANQDQTVSDLVQAAQLLARHDMRLPSDAIATLTDALPESLPVQVELPGL